MNRGICRNSRQLCSKKWRKYENTAKFGHINTETSSTGNGRNSGVLSLFPRDEKWCVFTRHRRRKVVWLHSSPKKKSGVSSLITKGDKWCVFVYHQRQNSAVSSPSPTRKQKCDFVYHELWNTGVFAHYQQRKNGVSSFITYDGKTVCSPITNEETVVCLRLSPMNGQRCVFVHHQQWKNVVSPLVMKGGKNKKISIL
jgi:hypothetical protein